MRWHAIDDRPVTELFRKKIGSISWRVYSSLFVIGRMGDTPGYVRKMQLGLFAILYKVSGQEELHEYSLLCKIFVISTCRDLMLLMRGSLGYIEY